MCLSIVFLQTYVFLKILQYSQENTCVRSLIKKENPTQVFSCEQCEIFKNIFWLWGLKEYDYQIRENKNNLNAVSAFIKIKKVISKRIILTKTTFTKSVLPFPVRKNQSSCFQMTLRKVILRVITCSKSIKFLTIKTIC